METKKLWDMQRIILVKIEANGKELQNLNQASSNLLAKRQMKCEKIHLEKNKS